jgi:hypothetical protein
MKRFCICFICLILLLWFLSCDMLRDGPFEVAAWSPGDGYFDPSSVELSLVFSGDPDRVSVERSFSLTENSRTLGGHFSWSGRRMIFTPASPLGVNKDYLITLKINAQDTRGLSLERQFEGAFTTRDGRIRPRLVSTVPLDGAVMEEEQGRVELVFSEALNRTSLQNLSFSPTVTGVWSLEAGGTKAVFDPSESWITGREYRLSIGSGLEGYTELETGRSYALHFSAGLDRIGPELLSASALDMNGTVALPLEGNMENSLWERNYRLQLVFSEPVDTASVSSSLSCVPSLGMVLETPPGYAETLVYRFSDAPAYNSSFTLTLEKNVKDRAGNLMTERIVRHIKADGPLSKTPVLRGMRIPLVPGTADTAEMAVYTPEELFADLPLTGTNYTFDTGISVWIELYFETAPGAVINLLSLMDLFKISATNGALNFSPRSMHLSGFTLSQSAAGFESLCRVEIRGVLTNRPYMGMVTIETGAGLQDSFGNAAGEAFRILLLK